MLRNLTLGVKQKDKDDKFIDKHDKQCILGSSQKQKKRMSVHCCRVTRIIAACKREKGVKEQEQRETDSCYYTYSSADD